MVTHKILVWYINPHFVDFKVNVVHVTCLYAGNPPFRNLTPAAGWNRRPARQLKSFRQIQYPGEKGGEYEVDPHRYTSLILWRGSYNKVVTTPKN